MGDQPCERRLLVIDDEIFVRELLEEYFGRLGYEVVAADSGESGVAAAQAGGFCVVLVDLKMPGMDGIETLREIRRLDPLCLTVVMTGYPTIDSSIEALRSGAYDYVIKPFKLGELREVVERAAREYRLKVEVDAIQQRIETVEGELRRYRNSMPHSGGTTAKPPAREDNRRRQPEIHELDPLQDAGHLSPGEDEQRKQQLRFRP